MNFVNRLKLKVVNFIYFSNLNNVLYLPFDHQ